MGIYTMGAASSANKETRALQLKAYLDTTDPKDYSSLIALQKSGAGSWTTFRSYLSLIKKQYEADLTANGQSNMIIADRESKLLSKANKRAKRHNI